MNHALLHPVHSLARAITLVTLTLGMATGPAMADPNRIVILSGQDSKPYQTVVAGFQQSLVKQGITLKVESLTLQRNQGKTQDALVDVKRNGAKLVVTLGNQATQAAVREIRDLPILASMIITADDIRSSPNATAVLLDFPVETQLQWIKRVVPNIGSVGILFNPVENRSKIEAASKAAKEAGLTLIPQPVETPRALPDALE